jgi:S1-C subfamily serine protease
MAPHTFAQTAQPVATPAPQCQVGIGVQVYVPRASLSADARKHSDHIVLSAKVPLRVWAVVPNGPATNATTVLPGKTQTIASPVQKGDIIAAVDGKSVFGKKPSAVIAEIDNGPAGSTVTLLIKRDGEHIGRTVTIKRDNFCLPASLQPGGK